MKVLIISHNPITTYHNMGKTFLSLFSSFSRDELCQLYIYPTLPDIYVCNSYYRVTDRSVLKSFFKLGKVESRIIYKEDIDTTNHSMYETEDDASFFKRKKKNALSLLCRDMIWLFAKWYNSSLKEWLDQEKPTCIFLAPGESKFIYNIALKIAKKLDINIFTYICDEYYFVESPKRYIDKCQVYALKNKIEHTLKNTESLITICDELKNIYHDRFNIAADTIHTGASYIMINEPNLKENIKGITYMGNLSNKRHESIAEIGNALDEINLKNGTDYKLFLYTNELNNVSKGCFENINSIIYCGYVTGKDYSDALFNADILLHVESFDEYCSKKVKHSISTKIPDYLGAGIPIMAYGPSSVASINYLCDIEAAFVCTKKEDLPLTILEAFNIDARKEISAKAIEIAKINHDAQKNSDRMYEILLRGSKN